MECMADSKNEREKKKEEEIKKVKLKNDRVRKEERV